MAPAFARTHRRGRLCLLAAAVLSLVLAGCGPINLTAPPATPTNFAGLLGRLAVAKISVDAYVSGDAGCTDQDMVQSAISFHAQGLDQAAPIKLYLYIFRDDDAFKKHLAQVGPCAESWVTDPSTYDEIDQSPYVLAGQGPWPAQFKAALRATLDAAAGTGG